VVGSEFWVVGWFSGGLVGLVGWVAGHVPRGLRVACCCEEI